MVSIIIPVYNVQDYLEKCFASVIRQTFTDFEVIVINDGSTDGSGVVCREWAKKDQRFRYFETENRGISITRRAGIQAATRKYVTFLDPDDWWDHSYLSEMMRPILQEGADMSICDIYYVYQNQHKEFFQERSNIRLQANTPINGLQNKDVIQLVRTFVWGKVILKALFEEGQMFPAYRTIEDIPVIPLLAALARKVVRVPNALYYYNCFRSNNLTNTQDYLQGMLDSLFQLCTNFKEKGLFAAYEKELMRLVFGQMRYVFNKAENFRFSDRESFQKNMLALWERLFPCAPNFAFIQFGVLGGTLLDQALIKIIIQETQIAWQVKYKEEITERLCTVDYVIADVSWKGQGYWAQTKGQILWIDQKAFEECATEEELLWNIADAIFYSVLQRQGKGNR